MAVHTHAAHGQWDGSSHRGGWRKQCRSLPQQSRRCAARLRGARVSTRTNLSADLPRSLCRCLQDLWALGVYCDVISLTLNCSETGAGEEAQQWQMMMGIVLTPLSTSQLPRSMWAHHMPFTPMITPRPAHAPVAALGYVTLRTSSQDGLCGGAV